MKAPDKIYIHRTYHLGLLSAAEIDITGQDEQYIRKDALLGWAKAEKEKCSIGLSEYDMGKENGKIEILDGLIDKLNSI